MLFQRKWPQETRDRGRRLYEAGAPFPLVGRDIEVPTRTVRDWAEADGWRRSEQPFPAAASATKARARRRRAGRPKARQHAYDQTWELVLRQHEVVLGLPSTTPIELARFECEMRRLTLLITLLAKLAPLVKVGAPLQPKEIRSDGSHSVDPGALLEEVARRFDAFCAAEQVAGLPEDADPGAAPGVS